MTHMVIHCIARSQVPKGSRYIYAFEPRVTIDDEAFNCKNRSFEGFRFVSFYLVYIRRYGTPFNKF